LHELLRELDDGSSAIADVWRALGHRARAEGLLQPSYATVRTLVRDLREERRLEYSRALRAAILAVEFLWNTRDRKGILLDAFDGADIERRRDRYKRRL
jgi:hypothetical protein